MRGDVSEVSHSNSLRPQPSEQEGCCGADGKKEHTGNIINILINNDIHSRIGIFVRSDVGDGEGFRHLDQPQCFSIM